MPHFVSELYVLGDEIHYCTCTKCTVGCKRVGFNAMEAVLTTQNKDSNGTVTTK